MKKILIIFCFSALSISDTFENFQNEHEQLKKKVGKMIEKNSTTYGMHQALITEYEELDKLLNKYYNHLMKTLDEEPKMKLRDSQREWIKFRDKEYEFYSSYFHSIGGGGSMWGIISGEHRNAVMLRRVEQLEILISDGEPK